MAPKAKPKAKSAAPAKAAAAKPKAEPKAKAKAKAAGPGSPAAGSGAAAVRQSRADAAAAVEAAEAEATVRSASKEDAAAAGAASKEAPPAAASTDGPKDAAASSEPPAPAAKEEPSESKDGEDCSGDEAEDAGRADAVVDLSAFPDPWESIDDDAAARMLREEEWEVAEPDGAPSAPAHLAARDAELSRFRASEEQRRWLVSADLAGNTIESIAAAGAPLWLRSLNLANNPLSSLAGLADGFPRLLVLDVSFVELPSIDDAWHVLASCPRLRRVTAECSGMSSLDDIETMPRLRSLDLMDNGIEEFEEVEALAKKCPNIEELDLRENEVVHTGNYLKKVRALFPKLTFLDNQSQKAYVAKRQDEAYSGIEGMNKEIMAVDGMYKNESCSCLEGNPCLDPATCKDWKNREKVAAEARKRKALRDDTGKICD